MSRLLARSVCRWGRWSQRQRCTRPYTTSPEGKGVGPASTTKQEDASPPPPKPEVHSMYQINHHLPLGYQIGAIGVPNTQPALRVATLLSTPGRPCSAAAVFTTNQFRAAPVRVSQEALHASAGESRDGVAVVMNGAIANACTGDAGLTDARAVAAAARAHFRVPHAFLLSTGVMGRALPTDGLLAAYARDMTGAMGTTLEHWTAAARAIMTTDRFPKVRRVCRVRRRSRRAGRRCCRPSFRASPAPARTAWRACARGADR